MIVEFQNSMIPKFIVVDESTIQLKMEDNLDIRLDLCEVGEEPHAYWS